MGRDTTSGPFEIIALRRIPRSRNGNPAWEIVLRRAPGDAIWTRTQSDASISYELDERWTGATVMATFTRAGRVADLERVER